jgi:hypothetical protein
MANPMNDPIDQLARRARSRIGLRSASVNPITKETTPMA